MEEVNEIDVEETLEKLKSNDSSLTHCIFNNVVGNSSIAVCIEVAIITPPFQVSEVMALIAFENNAIRHK